MGLLDRFKKKDDLDDFSDLGDFGLDDPDSSQKGAGVEGVEGIGALPGEAPEGRHVIEQNTASQAMSTDLGIQKETNDSSAGMETDYGDPTALKQHTGMPASNQMARAQQSAQQFNSHAESASNKIQSRSFNEFGKDIEIIHAKLDAIRSSLESINQRLATLERMASPDNRSNRYSW